MTLNRRGIVKLHRWLGLAVAAFWLLQAVTGTLIVFHWEMRDAMISDVERSLDLAAIERRLDVLAPPGSAAAIESMWTTAGFPDRYDISFADAAGESRSIRIAGDGTILRGLDSSRGAFIDTLVNLHHNLLVGETGDWIIGISGLLLITNLIAGLTMAWPRKGTWRLALKPAGKAGSAARLYSWHRAAGLWLVLPLLLIVATGTMLKFPDALASVPGNVTPTLPSLPVAGKSVGFAKAADVALKALPGSELTAVSFPVADDATYGIRLHTPAEMRRAYGASIVFVNANDGSLRGSFPITQASLGTRFVAAIIPIHTAQAFGPIGRLALFVAGLGLITLVLIGLLLWTRRRKQRKMA